MHSHEELEQKFGESLRLEPSHMVAVSSGTTALHLGIECLRLEKYMRFAVPNYTMVACARAVAMAGIVPTFVDCESAPSVNVNLDVFKIPKNLSGLMVVHVYGRRCDMKVIHADNTFGTKIVEDMAELHGIPPDPLTDVAAWSFYKNKVIAGEEGGMIWFREKELANNARSLRSLGANGLNNYQHQPGGFNYRMAPAMANLVLDSLYNFKANLHTRRLVERQYVSLLPDFLTHAETDSPWVYDVRMRSMKREHMQVIVTALQAERIEARMGFYPMDGQKEFYNGPMATRCPESWLASNEVFYLPIFQNGKPVSKQQIYKTARILRKVLHSTPVVG